ncbi:MAG: ribosomal protein [Pseudomonadota bacterium]
MPKMKTKSGAAKRFRVRASGSIKRGQAFKRHISVLEFAQAVLSNVVKRSSAIF